MERMQVNHKNHKLLESAVTKFISWLLIMSILVTLPILPETMTKVKAAENPINITLHFDNSSVKFDKPALQYWGGDAEVSGAVETDKPIAGWGDALGQLLTQEEGTDLWTITLKGNFTGFQFLNFESPSEGKSPISGFVSTMSQYTYDTPKDLYFLYNENDGQFSWYLDAEGETLLPEPQETNIKLHFQNYSNWEVPAVQYWQPENITVSNQVEESVIPGWGGVLGHVMTYDSGFYTISLKGIIEGLQFLDMKNPDNNTGGSTYNKEMNKYIGETPKDIYYLYKDNTWNWYMDPEGNTTLDSTKVVLETVNDNPDGTITFTTIASKADKVDLVYGIKTEVEDIGEAALTTVSMTADVNDSWNSSPIFFKDQKTEVIYYYLVDGVKKAIAEPISVGNQEYNLYEKPEFLGRHVYIPGTLPGKSWDPASNQMSYLKDGVYSLKFEQVPAGTYQYKIAMGSWNENYGANGVANGDNIEMTVAEQQDVIIYYSDFSHYSRTNLDYVYGASIEMSGIGIESTKLTDDRLTGIYSTTLFLTKDKYDDIEITYNENTYKFDSFVLEEDKKVTFYFDPETELYYNDASTVEIETKDIYYDTRNSDYKNIYGAVPMNEPVTFSIDTGEDVTGVEMYVKGKEKKTLIMEKLDKVNGVQRWSTETSFTVLGEYNYFFAIHANGALKLYGDDDGNYGTGMVCDLQDLMPYDFIVYKDDYKTPDWMKDAVIYQIFPDRFLDGDTSNNMAQTKARGDVDYEYVTDWYMLPENPEQEENYPDTYPNNAFKGDGEWGNDIYGGDLKGVIDRIDYLKALGVNVIYLNPVFSSISNHRYDTSDYMEIDPILGTEGDFQELVKVAKENDMHIILDGVFNHVSDDSKYFDRYYKYLDKLKTSKDKTKSIGAYPYWAYVFDLMNSDKSLSEEKAKEAAEKYFKEEYGINDWTYTKWFDFNGKDSYILDGDKPAVDKIGLRIGEPIYSYDCWWGYDSMPVVMATEGSEYRTPGWAKEIIGTDEMSEESDGSVTQYWLSEGMDGWRLDVANEVSDETWQHFRNSVKSLNSDNVIIGEIWTDAVSYLLGDMYDSVMNYVFRGAVLDYSTGGSAKNYIETLERLRERYPKEAYYAMMNLVSSHDTTRILSYLDGVPDDRGEADNIDKAYPSYEKTSELAKRRQYLAAFLQFTYPGAPTIYYGDEIGMVGADDPDDRRSMTWGAGNKEIVEWYAKLGNIHNSYPALRTGDVQVFETNTKNIVSYVRNDETSEMIVLANNSEESVTVTLDLAAMNVSKVIEFTDIISGKTITNTDDELVVTVPKLSGVILTDSTKTVNVETDKEALKPAYDSSYIVKDAKVTLSKTSIKLFKGASDTITATGRDTITWESSNDKVAKVINGKITGVRAGTATITATQTDGQKAICIVTVTSGFNPEPNPSNPEPSPEVEVTDVLLNKSVLSLQKGKNYTLKATVKPVEAKDIDIRWKSSKASVVAVDNNGKLTAKAAGTATITATAPNGVKATCKVTVKIPSKKVLTSTSEWVKVGSNKTLYATVTPFDTTDKITWTSSNKKIVTVNKKGKIKGIKPGKAKVTVTTTSGKKAVCKVTVVKKAKASKSIKLSKKTLKLNKGKTYILKSKMSPLSSTDSKKWSSSNNKVAKVDQNGVVTALKKGTAKITVKTTKGKKATCKVTVK